MTANLHCPYRNICKEFPNCNIDFRKCRFFIMAEAARDIKPLRWKPEPRK